MKIELLKPEYVKIDENLCRIETIFNIDQIQIVILEVRPAYPKECIFGFDENDNYLWQIKPAFESDDGQGVKRRIDPKIREPREKYTGMYIDDEGRLIAVIAGGEHYYLNHKNGKVDYVPNQGRPW